MKRVIIYLLVVFTLSACTNKDRLLSKAKKDAKEMVEKKAMEPANFNKDISLDEITPIYSSDSLCILYLSVKFKNLLGVDVTQRVEFVHFGDCWFVHAPDEDKKETTIFLPEELYEKEKKGKIYENSQYDDALYYRAALYMNKQNEEGELDIPITTGLWELGEYMDEYNKQTGHKYLLLSSSNGVEKGSDSDVKAELIVDNNEIYFNFLKKVLSSYSPVTSYGDIKISIEHSSGEKYGPWTFLVAKKGVVLPKNKKEQTEALRQLLKKEGKMTLMVRVDNFLIKSSFKFLMNVKGYNEAINYLR